MNKSTLAKISGIFSILFLAFSMAANALEVTVSGDVMTLDYTVNPDPWSNIDNYGNGDKAELRQSIKKLVIIGQYNNTTAFTNSNDWAIETLDLSQATLTSDYHFKNLYHLKNIVWPTTGTFVIPEQAFQTDVNHSALKSITIPSNCKEVNKYAFYNHSIETITFEGPSTYIRCEAFNNMKSIKDVYVQSGEEVDANGNYYCEKFAFDRDITYVQTQIESVDYAATLHIPTGANMANFRISTDFDVLTQAVLNDYYNDDANIHAKNGWHQFIKNSDAIVAGNQVFRTFSDTKAHKFPKCVDIEEGVKIYYIVGTTQINGVNKILIEPLNESDDYVLPANTGVLVYTKKGIVIYNSDRESSAPAVSQFAAPTPKGNTNYLVELQTASDNYFMSWSSSINSQKYINMFLSNKKDVDPSPREWGFYTIKRGTYTKEQIHNRAYLSMPTSIMTSTSMYGFYDGNGDVPPSVNNGKVFDLDIDELDGETTMIVNTKIDNDQTNSDNSYYNISGQKINEPSKGLYIHAGKKYMK